MIDRSVARNPIWVTLVSVLCLAGTWLYLQRVLVPYQVEDAAEHDRPRGNLSDLYPRWLGARELLLRGRNPYSSEVTREIQIGYYGRALDPSRPGDPKDQQAFAYPVYVVFYLAPTVHLPFAVVQRVFVWVLISLTIASALLWLRVLGWRLPWWGQFSAAAFLLGSLATLQGLKLQQITLFVAPLIAVAVLLLVRGRATLAGMLLAVATIKPQLVVGLIVWLVIWTLGNWKARLRWALSFAVAWIVLAAAAELLLQHWIPQFLHAVGEYQSYTGAVPLLDNLLPPPFSRLAQLLAAAAAACACWRIRMAPVGTDAFQAGTCLALSTTLLMVPSYALYNQVLLLPALLLAAREGAVWRHRFAPRFLSLAVAILLSWQWLSAAVLAGLSFLLPAPILFKAWAVPGWTVLTLPVAVTALMLIVVWRTSFQDAPGPIPS